MGQAAVKKSMDDRELKDVTLENVVETKKELGRGTYGIVFTVKHGEVVYAAKRIHTNLTDDLSREDWQAVRDDFVRECLCCSKVRHTNIVQFVGVSYSPADSRRSLPFIVMELMDASLTSFVENNRPRIHYQTKISILHDVSLGLSYLHEHDPQIIHGDLSSNNVMLTRCQIRAKIGDLGVAKMVWGDRKRTKNKLFRTSGSTVHFMPPEALVDDNPMYGTPTDLFSFGGIALHVLSEKWPIPSSQIMRESINEKPVILSEVKRRQKYLDKMTGEISVLKGLVEQCLNDNPDRRPTIQEVSSCIEPLKEWNSFAKALQSNQYHIKWTTCSDLPCKLYEASVAVSSTGEKVYVTAGSAPSDSTKNNVYSYNTNTDHWTVLPQPGHCCGILHMLEDRLTIFGGDDPFTYKPFNKVTTYDSDTNSWYRIYPDMINARFMPGIVTHHNHVIVMGGASNINTIYESIEFMDYCHHQLEWKESFCHLPAPMWGIKPTISADSVTIVGYGTATGQNIGCYQIKVTEIILLNQPITASIQWTKLVSPLYWNTATLPYSDPPVLIGGNVGGIPTLDITLYDASRNLWRKVDTLTSVRDCAGVALLNSNIIIVIGGTSGGTSVKEAKMSSLTTVEIGNIARNR